MNLIKILQVAVLVLSLLSFITASKSRSSSNRQLKRAIKVLREECAYQENIRLCKSVAVILESLSKSFGHKGGLIDDAEWLNDNRRFECDLTDLFTTGDAVTTNNNTLNFWCTNSPTPLRSINYGSSQIYALASLSEQILAVGLSDGTIRLLNWRTGDTIVAPWQADPLSVFYITKISTKSSSIIFAVSGASKNTEIWSYNLAKPTQTPKVLRTLRERNAVPVASVGYIGSPFRSGAFNPTLLDCDRLAVGTSGDLSFWNFNTGDFLFSKNQTNVVYSDLVDYNGKKLLITGSFEGPTGLAVWETSNIETENDVTLLKRFPSNQIRFVEGVLQFNRNQVLVSTDVGLFVLDLKNMSLSRVGTDKYTSTSAFLGEDLTATYSETKLSVALWKINSKKTLVSTFSWPNNIFYVQGVYDYPSPTCNRNQ